MKTLFTCLVALLAVSPLHAQAPNTWTRLDEADIVGQRYDIPLGYAADLKKFVILGGRTNYGEYKKPRSYDVLHLDLKASKWENAFPAGKDWGPRFGPSMAPAWKSETFGLSDSEGNARPNWTVYGTFSLGQKYDYDPDTKTFLMYLGGKTLRYDPAKRAWTDLAPATHPEKELVGPLLWSSLCYDGHNKRFILFGGGNVRSPRGDPGTWSYDPAANAWRQLDLEKQPPQRANSRLVYEPAAKKIVLFGGDQLDQLLADTWTFDVTRDRWEEIKTDQCPRPRAGHALLWLPKAKQVLLLGGYTYTSATGYVESLYAPLPLEAWALDVGAGRWRLVRRWEPGKLVPQSDANRFLSAAADDEDRVVLLSKNATWSCLIDATAKEDATKFAAKSTDVVKRTGPHDPAWLQDVPAADPKLVARELEALPANTWTPRKTPKLPRPNLDWGGAAFASDLDLILRFSGGHSAYSGTAPQIYDVKTDRYRIPFAPEYPIEYVYSNDQVHGEWSFKGNPWMTGHTYKATGYDVNLHALVFAPHDHTFFFDPKKDRWFRSEAVSPFAADFYNVTVCATPRGAVVWATSRKGGQGLWELDARTLLWQPLPLKGELPLMRSPDRHGIAYDGKRDRLLMFSDVGKDKGRIAAYDFKTGRAEWLDPADKEKGLVSSREAIYVDRLDAALVGAHVPGEEGVLWPLYDCAANAWSGVKLEGPDPVGKRAFNNSLGLMYDPTRGLVWGVSQNSEVAVLRLDAKTLRK